MLLTPGKGAGHSILVSPAGRTSLRTETPPGQDETRAHTHTHGGETAGEVHTYWNCSRCHWCLMSRPLQSNQRDPLETERSPRAQELSPGASDGGQGARRHGENASWERGAKAGWHLSPFVALRGKRGGHAGGASSAWLLWRDGRRSRERG